MCIRASSYWNELSQAAQPGLIAAIGASDDTISLNAAGAAQAGSFLQIEGEILRVSEVSGGGLQYQVERAQHGTTAAAHAGGSRVYHLDRKTVVMPFPEDFFGSPYSGHWSFPVRLPDVRLASAELFVTNRRGNSPAEIVNFTQTSSHGLRTLSGGQYTIQVAGFLAIDQNAAPALVVEDAHAVRDVFAVIGQAADAEVQVQVKVNDTPYCTLAIPAGQFSSNGVDGFPLPLLTSGSLISISVLAVGQTIPGSDLTVVIRL